MNDVLYKGRLEALEVAFSYAVTTDTVNEAVTRHQADPVAAHVLGRAMTGALLAAAPLGAGQRLNARWAYQGHLRTVLVDAGPDGALRGFISPVDLAHRGGGAPELHGEGCDLQVIRSRGAAVLSSGHVATPMQDVIEDLAHFLAISDQVESALAVVIGFDPNPERPVNLCRGLLLQALPGCDLDRFDRLRRRLHGPEAQAWLIRPGESDSLVENVLNLLARDETTPPGLLLEEAGAPHFQCACSREKMGAVLRALPYADRMDLVRKQEAVQVNCHFCNTRYTLTVEECVRAWNHQPIDGPAAGEPPS